MRRIFALLAVASLSGCITDGPNKTGSAWLDDLDLGPQGFQTVTIPVGAQLVDTIVLPGVPSYSGLGTLVVGDADAFSSVTSLWFDAKDTTRWSSGGTTGLVEPGWTLRLRLDESCSDTLRLSRWNSGLDTGAFLLGAGVSSTPDAELAGKCTNDSSKYYVDFRLGDSTDIVRKQTSFGVRLAGTGFPMRQVLAANVLNNKGDTLKFALHEGRGAWGTRLVRKRGGSITGMASSGTRLRIRFSGEGLRSRLQSALGLSAVESDSFDNTIAVFSARMNAPIVSASTGTAHRFRLASWTVLSRDTSDAPFGGSQSVPFVSKRARDGKSMEGDLKVDWFEGGLARVSLVSSGDSVPFYTTQGKIVYHFYLFPGEAIEAPMYKDPGWTKFWFRNDSTRLRFVRTVLYDGVIADDQVQGLDGNADVVYREEAIARPGVENVRFEARASVGRILNNKKLEVWTDLYPSDLDDDASIGARFRIDLRANPLDSVTFIVRRRNQGVVE